LLVDFLEKGENQHSKVLRCTFQQNEAAIGLQTSRQVVEESCIFKAMLLLIRRPLRTTYWQTFALKFWNTRPTILTWPLRAATSSNLKKHLKGRQLSSTVDAILAVDGRFAAKPKVFFLDELMKLEQRNHKCVVLKGEYVE
jgi:hypothetical protein